MILIQTNVKFVARILLENMHLCKIIRALLMTEYI